MTMVVGLTGGIGSGKSTVARLFSDLGVPVLDADDIARQVVEPGEPGLLAIQQTFGDQIIDERGHLNRARLRKRIFSDSEAKLTLENLLHPLIRKALETAIAQLHADYCIVCIPLLVESGWLDLVDRVLVVDTDENIQRQRASERDGLTGADVEAIMQTQCTREARLRHATEVIRNDGTIEDLAGKVAKLHEIYRRAAFGRFENRPGQK